MGENSTSVNLDKEWQNRKLCSDGNCIGVIGKNGFCSECGRKSIENGEASPGGFEAETLEAHGDDLSAEPPDADSAEDSDWENRVLCSDENCIGIMGPDGRCTACGKPAAG
jgi:hypothetical protein